jgi:hypothetical protein
MALLTRKRTLLAKLESTYGVDPTPTGSANAIQVTNLEVTPLNAETVSRDLIRPFFGNSDTLLAQTSAQLTFEIELAGTGVVGGVPGWSDVLAACGFDFVRGSASVAITRSGAVATATLTGHTFVVGDRIEIDNATETEYNGIHTITAVGVNTFDFAVTGTPTSPASGAPVVFTEVVYTPITDNLPSVSFYFQLDGVRQKILGARGSVQFSLNVKEIPKMAFSFTGFYASPTDTAAPSVDFSKFAQPKVVNTSNTTSFSLLSYSGLLESMSLDMACDVQFRQLVGLEQVNLIDRKPAGTFVIEAPSIASKNFFEAAKNGDFGDMSISHGSVNGNIVEISCPRVNIQNPSYQDSQGVHMLSIPFVATPDVGNDEIEIVVK